jgi:hypothetical protein
LNGYPQILDLPVDNALCHGEETVRITVCDAFGALAIDVSDEGSLTATQPNSSGGESAGVRATVSDSDLLAILPSPRADG